MVYCAEINLPPPPYSMLQHLVAGKRHQSLFQETALDTCKHLQILDDGGRGIGLRIYVSYCLKKINEK